MNKKGKSATSSNKTSLTMSFIKFLFNNYEAVKQAEIGPLSSVCAHSGKVKDSSLFIALKGKKTDGHNYLKQAIGKGASALLVEKTDQIPSDFKGIVLKYQNKLRNLHEILNQFYNFPAKRLFAVGVTGTNGKTSVCCLLERCFQFCGWPAGVMGTVDQHFNQHSWPAVLTTPEPAEIFERLNDFVRLEAKAVIMEASSHALDQNRLRGIDFNGLVFTNLTQDHLDYHGSMENYFRAKAKLFTQMEDGTNKSCFCLVNQDDEYGQRLKKMTQIPCWTYGADSASDFCFKIKSRAGFGSAVELKTPYGLYEFFLPLAGDYNVYNAVSALACALLTGFKGKDCLQALKGFPGAPGRLEKAPAKNLPFDIFIDYAHTPSALSCVLQALKNQGKNVILVFGCGGDRDQEKRPAMAGIALKFSDRIFLTTDNPRFEEPEQIARQALKQLSAKDRARITVELDRKEAIKKAIQSANSGDLILIAGKGHERFQLIKNKKIPFCDREIALDCLKELGWPSAVS